MGGLKVEVEEKWSWILVDGCTLTPSGVLLLAQLNVLPRLEVDTIMDKSKDDVWSKTLVCIQVVWGLAQLIGRVASGLPVTQLEINTLAHVGCALVFYAIWWYKPKDVYQPFTVKISPLLAAVMAAPTRFYCRSGFRRRRFDFGKAHPFMHRHNAHRSAITVSTDRIYLENCWISWEELIPENTSGYKVRKSSLQCPEWDSLSNFDKAVRIQKAFQPDGVVMLLPGQQLEDRPWCSRTHPIHLNRNCAEKLIRLAELEETKEYADLEQHVERLLIKDFPKLFLTKSQPNGPDATSQHFHKPYYLLAMLSLVYGAIHAIPWNQHFPSTAEQTLWRISVCIVSIGGLVVWSLMEVFHRGREVLKDIAGLLIGVVVIVWSLARAFLILEALASLRSLPSGAYDTVRWTNWLPHFG